MKLTKISGGCEDDNCPAVYATGRETYIVQGYVINDPDVLQELGLPAGESAVEVPVDLVRGLRAAAE
ncbi:hypothetical protein [Nocardiopsis quinghaiensis]|uniref:hypothetical protein n=1 Tax=Nocardiopsis quinghaiensis TaxID=464995 RepID=UPI001238DB4A|nr:hypothetical protein [Nocardiopsis quinghaiensis]